MIDYYRSPIPDTSIHTCKEGYRGNGKVCKGLLSLRNVE